MLAGIFRKIRHSYKYLLLRSLLDIVKEGRLDERITSAELSCRMLMRAWQLVRQYKASLGEDDRIHKLLTSSKLPQILGCRDNNELASMSLNSISKRLGEIIAKQGLLPHNRAIEYVLTRSLVPWLEPCTDLRPYKRQDSKKNRLLIELSKTCFEDAKPLYRIEVGLEKKLSIIMHPAWTNYFLLNMGIVEGWLDQQWLIYLQARNPNMPMLSDKLWGQAARKSLGRQRKFWLPVFQREFRCIYSEDVVTIESYALDHFIPRMWIGHDQLWNLIPASKKANSMKSANLPNAQMIDKLVDAHCCVLKLQASSNAQWTKLVQDYVDGLRLEPQQLLDRSELEHAFKSTFNSQLELAKQYGFKQMDLPIIQSS